VAGSRARPPWRPASSRTDALDEQLGRFQASGLEGGSLLGGAGAGGRHRRTLTRHLSAVNPTHETIGANRVVDDKSVTPGLESCHVGLSDDRAGGSRPLSRNSPLLVPTGRRLTVSIMRAARWVRGWAPPEFLGRVVRGDYGVPNHSTADRGYSCTTCRRLLPRPRIEATPCWLWRCEAWLLADCWQLCEQPAVYVQRARQPNRARALSAMRSGRSSGIQ
jgi:hypothetical protein